MYRRRRPANMPNHSNAYYEFMRQAKRADQLGLGRWIDAYMPRGDVSIHEMYSAAERLRVALDRQEVKQ
jgi:hypothetical protein